MGVRSFCIFDIHDYQVLYTNINIFWIIHWYTVSSYWYTLIFSTRDDNFHLSNVLLFGWNYKNTESIRSLLAQKFVLVLPLYLLIELLGNIFISNFISYIFHFFSVLENKAKVKLKSIFLHFSIVNLCHFHSRVSMGILFSRVKNRVLPISPLFSVSDFVTSFRIIYLLILFISANRFNPFYQLFL